MVCHNASTSPNARHDTRNFEGTVIFLDAVCLEDGELAKHLFHKPKGSIIRAALGLDLPLMMR